MDSRANTDPLVSIVIPFFHTYTQYLSECLDSVRHQTYDRWQAILVDDASPGNPVAAIIARYQDARFTLLRHETNRGQAAARNTGMHAASGELLMALDCDDVLAPRHLERLVGALSLAPECGVAYSDLQLFSGASAVVSYPVQDTQALLREQWIPHPGTVVRRHLWEEAHGYCEDPVFRAGNEDWDYWLSVAEVGLRAVRVPEPLYWYRQHDGSITNLQFACADYRMREAMYARHRALFDRYRMRRPFLAKGYRTSGAAFLSHGAPGRALLLLGRAAWLSPADFVRGALRRLERRAGGATAPPR